ncbi:hypothetical protein SGCZBJ_08345 [Caulobacter zeae]|uniref:Uncharacterized protein n=1 Tax=Caulobacter zeae TaxID=2055137 RepID=A0A2N5DL45_9CAUL|nr:hypothetical protein [Caulobacter zeae]PLR26766.1 hypothetical protein SGCZBJ_08345 [Caulobacter zeae]
MTVGLADGEKTYFGAINAAARFAEVCAGYHLANPYPEQGAPLDHVINTLMTELWDQGFSQTQIRAAFEAALADMNRYAAGEEHRP